MIMLDLAKDCPTPLYEQVFVRIRDMIESRTLAPGERLPATRVLAERHGISRTVVYRAYQELWGQGYLESRPGSYSIVRRKAPSISVDQRTRPGLIDWEQALTCQSNRINAAMLDVPRCDSEAYPAGIMNLGTLSLDRRTFPLEEFKRCLGQALHDDPGLLNYGPVEGLPALREAVAMRMRAHSIHVSPEEVLITNGTQHSIDLVLRLLAGPGTTVATESPTYYNVLPLMRFCRARVLGIPMREDGLDLDAYERAARGKPPVLLYTIPNFHNPTGITTCQDHRERLLAISTRYRIPVVEDAFEEEMKYCGKVPLAIKSMDRDQIVIYLSSFSKVLFPGLRLGWIAADREFIRRAARLKMATEISSNSLSQAALAEFCRAGYYDMHVKRMHRLYKRRMQTALALLRQQIDLPDVSWRDPLGGFLIWLRLDKLAVGEDELHALFARHGFRVPRGSLCFVDGAPAHHVRLSISSLDEDEIAEGIRRLAGALHEAYARHRKG